MSTYDENSWPTYERKLDETATWAVAVVCFVLLAISIFIEHLIHLIEKWLKKKHRPALIEALEKVKAELMLLGFISLLLTVFQEYISSICVPKSVALSWRPCNGPAKLKPYPKRRLLEFEEHEGEWVPRRSLATLGKDQCKEGKLAFVTAYAIHQLHIFIFVLAIFHVLYCIITLAMGNLKMRRWKNWEDETKTPEHQYYNDPERFRFARETSFGRRHLHAWSRSPITLWIVCFFRQFFGSVTKTDYFALRHGFIMAHLTAESDLRFDFQNYIHKTLEGDFKIIVGISPVIWCSALLFLLSNTYGWYSYLWLPFIPLIIILLVGTKLQVIITRMGLRIQERGDVVKGTPLVQPGDDLFWFGKPRFILFLIHFVLFQNAFMLAFFVWSTWQFKGIHNCFHQTDADIIIRISVGVIVQVVCSYVTLPLYALVTQMGSKMKPTIFDYRVATALKNWHHSAKKHAKSSKHSNSATPFSSRPATPERGSSPVHLLHAYQHRSVDDLQAFSRHSNVENEQWANAESSHSPHRNSHDGDDAQWAPHEQEAMIQLANTRDDAAPVQHEINISPSDFSFGK